MRYIDFLLDVFGANTGKEAIIWRDQAYSYGWMAAAVERWKDRLEEENVEPGNVVSLEGDFSPNVVALLLALIGRGCVIVPLTTSVHAQKPHFRHIAEVEVIIVVGEDDQVQLERTGGTVRHKILKTLKEKHEPGLVLFSSGSTGEPKATVHALAPLLEKFKAPRHSMRSITFLMFDHVGGLNTLFYNLSNAGCVITVQDRSPAAVCAAIEKHGAQLLPTSPTFINLLLLSEAYKRYDLSSLQLVTYGTEVMPESTLKRVCELLPDVRLLQTYGLTELGVLRSKSRSSASLWVKVGGEDYETRVVDGMLEIKAKSIMLGYLNGDSPFTEDGWFKTGDAVEVDGEYIRILGRKSEMINVGGEKVYPVEVESVLRLMDGVEDVVVSGERNPITGQIVKARVKLVTGENAAEFRKRMHVFCRDKLPKFKIPQRVVLVDEKMYGDRFKKVR